MGKHKTILQFTSKILDHKVTNQEVIDDYHSLKINWNTFVRVASSHLVLPTVYCRLKDRRLLHILPPDLNTYLKKITALNEARNLALIKEAERINKLLVAHGYDYVFLKGIALLKGKYYNHIAERMIGDIDILVHPEHIHLVFTLLKQHGYYTKEDETINRTYFEHRHLPRLLSDTNIGAIELHDALLNTNSKLLNPISVLKFKKWISNFPIPKEQDLLIYNVLNFQINDKAFLYGTFNLRNAYDTLTIETHHYKNLDNFKEIVNLDRRGIYFCYFKMYNSYFKTTFCKQKKRVLSFLAGFFIFKNNYPILNKIYVFMVGVITYIVLLMVRLKMFLTHRAYRKKMLSKIAFF